MARGARPWSPSQKLPSTAIYCDYGPQNRCDCFNRTFLYLPLEGVPASLGPGLRTVSGADRSLGAKLPPSAICPMTGESANSQKKLLAAAIAEGTAVGKWASSNEVPERTAYRWAAEWLKARAGTLHAEATRPLGSRRSQAVLAK
jgi:hypothetical protein